MDNNTAARKVKYGTFCQDHIDTVFQKDWWLDSVCGADGWDVVLFEVQEKVLGAMPYAISKKGFYTIISQPIFTQKLGPCLVYPDGINQNKLLSFEKKAFTFLIEQLPKFDLFQQNFNNHTKNWLPFYWKGFKQTTRYSYRIDNINNIDDVYDGFDRSKKKQIKKGLKEVEIRYDLSAREFYESHVQTLAQNGKKISYSYDVFNRIYENAKQRDSGKIIAAFDQDKNLHAALFIVWDRECAYNLISTIDVRHRNSGASTLVVYEAIKSVRNSTGAFDFCGSMDVNIENSIRKFGGNQIPYFSISKNNSFVLSFLDLVKQN
tara:strand:- start:40 stop:999 length:960 start_codon:yes stop_codon:yes gene_type:complete